jgi:structural maintenance of chromosome 3 (chondroitin sulfate proteoglycan 6)
MPRPVRRALTEAIAKVEKNDLGNKVLGTLVDAIRVEDQYAVAVESAAGNALFNLLVVDDEIAADIIKYVRQNQLGSIVCTPLNQIRPRQREYPKLKGCKPLIDVIQCNDDIRPAVLQVFGRTMICNTLELCDVVSNKHGLDAVTYEGDRVSSQGTMTGGYQDPGKYVRLKICAERKQFERQLQEYEGQQLPELEGLIKESSTQLDKLHQRKREVHSLRQARRAELSQAAEALHENDRELRRLGEAVVRQKEREHEAATSLAEYTAGIEALTRERQSKTLGQLTAEEHAEMERLSEELKTLVVDVRTSEEEHHKLQREVRQREQHLNGYLRRRCQEVEAELLRASQQDHEELKQERHRAVARLKAQADDIEAEMKRLSKDLSDEDDKMKEKTAEKEAALKEIEHVQASVNAYMAGIDDTAVKISSLTKKKAEYDEKLRKLTVVAGDLARYREMATKDILDEMTSVNKDLQKFEHVNKKAIDQFATFQDQLRDLDEEGLEIKRSREAIEHFIAEVDAKKEHLLNDVLEKVNKHFRDIFRELVRDGQAKLSVVTEVDEDIEAAAKKRRVPHAAPELAGGIKGVRIEVSFTGQATSFLTMSQLSGGQKTVVALTLIFAIQRLEPAPFYLFDEVDAALDTQYRTAVARLVQKDAANGAQMIITTFRPEIIEIADSCYRVTMRNRVSAIDTVERAQAKEVVDQQVAQEGLGE